MCGLAISVDRHAEAQADATTAAWAPGTSVATALGSSSQQPEEGELAAGHSDNVLIPKGRIDWHLPDPEIHRPGALELLERARQEGNKAVVTNITRVIDRLDAIRRPEQLSLTLEDALRRALENSYVIQVASYNPAVETTRVVEAEAAFDAVFFTDVIKNIQDRPSGSELTSSDVDFFSLSSGVRKLLPLGTQVSASYGMQRTKTSIQFQQINPEYFNNIVLEMRQPFLRGFGLDQNRSLIMNFRRYHLI